MDENKNQSVTHMLKGAPLQPINTNVIGQFCFQILCSTLLLRNSYFEMQCIPVCVLIPFALKI